MAGIDKILDAIKSDTDTVVKEIANEGKAIANKMLEDAKKAMEKEKAEFDNQSESMAKLRREKGVSTADAKKSRMILEEKQNLIQTTIQGAKDKIRNMSSDKYFDIINKLVINNAHKEDGKIAFSSKDSSRLPADFIEKLNKKLKEDSKGKLTLEKRQDLVEDGVMLIYGETQENLSIDSIFSEKKEMLEDMINTSLFG